MVLPADGGSETILQGAAYVRYIDEVCGPLIDPASGVFRTPPVTGGGYRIYMAGGGSRTPLAGGGSRTPLAGGGSGTPLAGGDSGTPLAGELCIIYI